MKVLHNLILTCTLIISLCLYSVSAYAQVLCTEVAPSTYQICDDFSDGDLSTNPAWIFDDSNWQITDGQLNSNGPAETGTVMQVVANAETGFGTQWEFFANPKLATSSGNYTDIYLLNSTQDLLAGDGYFIRIGGTPDEVSLFRQDAGEATLLIDGEDGIIGSSSNNPVRIKVTYNSNGDWNVFTDIGATGIFPASSTANDNTYTNGSFFGILVKYSQANNTSFFFDDIYVGDLIIDTTPPTVEEVVALDENTIKVSFSEAVLASTAENASNYTTNVSISNATLTSATEVTLTSTDALSSGFHDITISNVNDLAGNEMATQTLTFAYVNAFPLDVLINEIMADQAPVVGLPESEYIELYNTTTLPINLGGWQLQVNASFATLPSVDIPPQGYIVLCEDDYVAEFEALGLDNVYQGWTGSSFVTNGGTLINLQSNTGANINTVFFSDDWYQDSSKDDGGWSLELINPNNPCSDGNNWSASTNANGGTPGSENSLFDPNSDSEAPTFEVVIEDNTTLEVTFNETVTPETANSLANYSISPSLPIDELYVNNLTVTIELGTEITLGTIYTLTINEVSDCLGNTTDNATGSFALGDIANIFDIVINEIFVDVTFTEGFENPNFELPAEEYVELYNRSDKNINLEGWQFRDVNDTASLPAFLMLPGDYAILCASSKVADFQNYDENLTVIGVSPFNFKQTGDILELASNQGDLVSTVINYGTSWYGEERKEGGGWSLEMIDPNNPCEGLNNWSATEDARGGTPGEVNSIKADNPDTTLPNLERAEAMNTNRVAVYFNEVINPESIQNLAAFTIDNSIGNPTSAAVSSLDPQVVNLQLSTALQEGVIYNLSISRESNSSVTDCVGNELSMYNEAQFGIARPAEEGELIINEILAEQPSGGADFIELYNTTNEVLLLQGLCFTDADLENNDPETLTNYKATVVSRYSILPNSYVVFTEQPDFIKTYYGVCGEDLNPYKFINADLPTYDTEDVVALVKCNIFDSLSIVDKVFYNNDWHNPLLDETKGVSLERIDVTAPSQDANNWQSAVSSVCFATPGYINSQSSTNTIAENSSLSIEPSTFSPDGDNNDEFLQIFYDFDEPNFTLNITIFDERGREINHLVKSDLVGNNGFVKWDGTNENGEKAPIGIYIIFVEAFNAEGKTEQLKTTCVLAGRLD